MAPECTYDQTLSNLANNAVRVFESILKAECRQILSEVKAIRAQRIYPTCRVRYQIVGQQYRHMILQTFRTTLPNVYRHLQRRKCFADYLLQTGIFNNADLDRQHHQLYDRILNHYLERYQHREMFGRNGEPDRRTDNSVEQSIGGEGLENLSLLPHKDGRPY